MLLEEETAYIFVALRLIQVIKRDSSFLLLLISFTTPYRKGWCTHDFVALRPNQLFESDAVLCERKNRPDFCCTTTRSGVKKRWQLSLISLLHQLTHIVPGLF